MREPLLLNEPWSWLLGESQSLSGDGALDGSGSPRLVASLDNENPGVFLSSGYTSLPAASFPFVIGNNAASEYHLPIETREQQEEKPLVMTVMLGDLAYELRQIGCPDRTASASEGRGGTDTIRDAVSAWIDWQIWAFQELGHLSARQGDAFDAPTRRACVRRSWTTASNVWLREGRDVARMALIVELSRQQALHRALDAISRHPRRILQRTREQTLLSRIQELDPACIRDLARRPGVSAIEKAGPRQQLLAVRRREQRDTLENRVTCWVLEAACELARDYCQANVAFSQDEKVRKVGAFGRRARTWRTSELLREVGPLVNHPTAPNYPLQFESRYQLIWKTYLRIRREKTVLDDAWAWQRVLWGETGRQLLGCCLHRLFEPAFASTVFYRNECHQGLWTEPPVSPGPFKTSWGNCIVFDSRDVAPPMRTSQNQWLRRPPFRGAEYFGASGCDQILLWPKAGRILLVWHFYHTALESSGDSCVGKILERCGKAIEVLAADLQRFAQAQYRLGGVLLIADLSTRVTRAADQHQACVTLEPGPQLKTGSTVNALCLPPDADTRKRFVEDLMEGIRLVVEELHR